MDATAPPAPPIDAPVRGSTTRISETITIDPPDQDVEEAVLRTEATLAEEYVAASENYWQPWNDNRLIRTLPNPSDDMMRDFGSDIYERQMPLDPQVNSLLRIFVMAILAQGMKLSPPIERGKPGYDDALLVQEFCLYNMRSMRTSPAKVLDELVDGMLKMGHKVGEQIYGRKLVGPEQIKRTVLLNIKTKPHNATAFVVDPYNNELGLVYMKPGEFASADSVSAVPGPTPDPPQGDTVKDGKGRVRRVIPRAKFVIPKNQPKNGDPRGTSHLRHIYTPYWKKQMWNPQHLAYIARFAQPSIWANISGAARDVPSSDGTRTGIVAKTNSALVKLKGGATGAGIDTEVDLLEASGDGKVIFDSYSHEDRQMAKGILMQTLTTEESQYMARAAGAIHQDVFGLLVASYRGNIEETWRKEVLEKLVLYNFGAEAAENFTPNVSLGDTEVQDIPKLMAAVAQLANAGIIHWSMYAALRTMLNLPAANEDEEENDREHDKMMAEAIGHAKQSEPGAPVKPGKPGKPGDAPNPERDGGEQDDEPDGPAAPTADGD